MSPSERLERLKEIQDAAQAQRQAEAARPREPLTDRLAHRIQYLRQREVRGWLMIEAEINECRRLEREIELDRQEERQGDWTR
jgi:GAF domain-containing protein